MQRTFLTTLGLALCGLLMAQEPKPKIVSARSTAPVKSVETIVKDGKTMQLPVVQYVNVEKQLELIPKKSAIIICDMWDQHWCPSATKRCDALAKKVAPIIDAARRQGMTIIHCPSDCMKFYADSKARQRTKELKPVPPPPDQKLPDPPLPIDDSDGGCDDVPQPKSFRAWTSQHPAITIDQERDFITEAGSEVYTILKTQGIEKVFIMGVHTNMCVLHRSFGIKQLKRWGVDCYLVRDITDTMYNPKMKPMVSHDEGTNLVIRFIETHWCPSVLSDVLK